MMTKPPLEPRQKSIPRRRKKDNLTYALTRTISESMQALPESHRKFQKSPRTENPRTRTPRSKPILRQSNQRGKISRKSSSTVPRNGSPLRNLYRPSIRSPVTRSQSRSLSLAKRQGEGQGEGQVIVISDDEELEVVEKQKQTKNGRKASVGKQARSSIPLSAEEQLSPHTRQKSSLKQGPRPPSPSPSPPPRTNSFSHQSSYISLSLPSQPPEYYIQERHLPFITAGTVVWLPSKIDMLPNAYVDPGLHVNAFDHPAVIINAPNPLTIDSVVEIAIMTSCHSRTLHETKQLSHRSRLLRVRTRALPCAKVDITFRDGKGMRGKYSYVNCMEKWGVEVGSLGFYGWGRGKGAGVGDKGKGNGMGNGEVEGEGLDWLVLTKVSLEKLRTCIEEGGKKGKGKKKER